MHTVSRLNAYILSFLGIFVVGLIDYFTGIEIRAFPLYFLPLIFAARYLGKKEAIGFAILATSAWVLCMLLVGREYSHLYIWFINFFTQGSTFILVTLLYSKINETLLKEATYSRTDSLTGLFNRRAFYERAESILRLCRRNNHSLSIAYIDLDNFKTANDLYGHDFGDEILRKVAELLKKSLRASDIIARMGGDEFAVLLPQTGAEGAGKAFEQFRTQLLQVPELSTCSITASIGVVSYLVAPIELELLIHTADTQMYRVKNSGKNHVIVESL